MALNFANVDKEYEKNPELKREDVSALIEWVNKQPHLPEINEIQAILFLQSCFCRNEFAKTTIDNYFTVKTLCPELFRNRNPTISPLKEALNVTMTYPMPKQTPEGDTVLFVKLVDVDAENYNFAMHMKYFDMVTMQHLHEFGTSRGHLIVVDMQGLTLTHLTKLTPLSMKKFLYYLQEAMPVRLRGFHYFNIVSFMDKVLALMKPFMKKELIDMLFLHNTVEDLAKVVPLACLPRDYGGEAATLPSLHERIKRKLSENVEFFNWEDKQTVDESRRLGKAKNVEYFFGVEGTFKKLELD